MIQWLGLSASTARGAGSTLVKELRSHKLFSTAKIITGHRHMESDVQQNSQWNVNHFDLFKIRSILCLLGSLTKVILLTVVGHKSVKSTCKLIWKSFYNLNMFIHLFTIIIFLVHFSWKAMYVQNIFHRNITMIELFVNMET